MGLIAGAHVRSRSGVEVTAKKCEVKQREKGNSKQQEDAGDAHQRHETGLSALPGTCIRGSGRRCYCSCESRGATQLQSIQPLPFLRGDECDKETKIKKRRLFSLRKSHANTGTICLACSACFRQLSNVLLSINYCT